MTYEEYNAVARFADGVLGCIVNKTKDEKNPEAKEALNFCFRIISLQKDIAELSWQAGADAEAQCQE